MHSNYSGGTWALNPGNGVPIYLRTPNSSDFAELKLPRARVGPHGGTCFVASGVVVRPG